MQNSRNQHEKEILETKVSWDRKPLLRQAYRRFHREIQDRLAVTSGTSVELGSGIGMIKETIPDCITSDIFPNPMVDRVEDAYALSFENHCVSNLILFDVWHHLEYPGTALEEFSRVLMPEGRIIMFEPAALSLLGRLVFGCFHHEPIHASGPPPYFLPRDQDYRDLGYYAAQGNAWKMFRRQKNATPFADGWIVREVTLFPAFDWLAAGGFRGRQLAPSFLDPFLCNISAVLAPFPSIFATRMLVVLEKIATDAKYTPGESTA
jgi:SAM-dependent methyltransferase